MFNSSKPSKEETEKQKRALEDMHKAHTQQAQSPAPIPSPIDEVIASWEKSLTASTSGGKNTLDTSADSPAPSPLFGHHEGQTKKKGNESHHQKKKSDASDILISLSVPSADLSGRDPAVSVTDPPHEEGKLIILDDYDNSKKKKSHSRHNSNTPPAPVPAAEAEADLVSLGSLLPPAGSSPASSSSASSSSTSASASPASLQQPQQPQQGGYTPPAQFLPQQGPYGAGGGAGPFSQPTQQGSGPLAPGSFHPPPYQNVPAGTPAGYPQQPYGGYSAPYGGYGAYPPQGRGPYPPQMGFPPQPGGMGYPPQAPLQQQMNAPMYNRPPPMGGGLGLSTPPYGQGGPIGMASPQQRPVSTPEVLADQLSNLDLAKQNYMNQAPMGGLIQPLVPVAAPVVSPDVKSAPAAAGGGTSGNSSSDEADEWHIDYNELETHKEIARGSFGVVYQGTFRGTEVAIKKLIQQHFSPEQMKDFVDEINMMKKLHHPNVVLLIGVCVKEPNLCIITELLAGSMWNLLHDKNVRLDWKLQHKLLLDTAKGMNYLHLFRPPIIHRDLKSPNLLVDSHFNVKIADFGLARIKAQLMTGNLGTCQYMAPEVITSATYSEKADVYSYGVVIWEVLTRQAPWQGMQPMQIAYGVVHQNMRPPIPPGTSPALVQLMQQCWHQDPNQRPSFTEILKQLKALPV